MANTFQQDLEFLRQHTETLVLGDPQHNAILLCPQYQGRVMTSTAGGASGTSFGWINYDLISSGQTVPQINLYGGEERFWLAPEGGRYSIFFPPAAVDKPLDFADWRVPICIDTEPFTMMSHNSTSACFHHHARLVNRMGYEFQIHFDRKVELLDASAICQTLDCELQDLAGLRQVVHQSQNRLVNTGGETWSPETGLLSIWVLCMNSPSQAATLVVPYRHPDGMAMKDLVNADYFGQLNRDRFWNDVTGRRLFLKGDGWYRSKLGLTWPAACPLLAAWDAQRKVLSFVWYNLPEDPYHASQLGAYASDRQVHYVNNLWQVCDDEYRGDVINGYNDGPNESGNRLGGFFELESLSPALALKPSQGYTHIHQTIRLQAEDDASWQQLDRLSKKVLGMGLQELEAVFPASGTGDGSTR